MHVNKTKISLKSYNPISKNDSFEKEFYHSKNTCIHSTAIIGPNVQIADNVKIGPFSILCGNISIKKNTIIHANVIIGTPAQHTEMDKPLGKIEIGENCKIREFTTIGSSIFENGKTIIGNNCYIMSYCHIAHDVKIEDNVVLINNVNLGGHVYVGKNAFLMANCASHQFCKIGDYCGLAPYSAIRQDIPPYCTFSGLPAKFYGLNRLALKRANFSQNNINALKHVTKLFYQDKLLLSDIEKLAQQNNDWGKDKYVLKFLEFVKTSTRGISKQSAI